MTPEIAVKYATVSVARLWDERTDIAKTARGTYTIASVWIGSVPRKCSNCM
jgi:hypothetical protein